MQANGLEWGEGYRPLGRHTLTELGDIELRAPRTRRFCPTGVLRRYTRRAPEIDRANLTGFALGLSTRKGG